MRITAALAAARHGKTYLSQGISVAGAIRTEQATSFQERLTKGKVQEFQLIADGKSAKAIAARLEISVKTVETHRKQIMISSKSTVSQD